MISRFFVALAGAVLAPGLAIAAVNPQLGSAARSVSYSTQQLVTALRAAAPADRIVGEAGAFYNVAERFSEEVTNGAQVLPRDYQTVQQEYGLVGQALAGDYAVAYNQQVRAAWQGVQQSMTWLGQVWGQTPQPQPQPQPQPFPQPQPQPQPFPRPQPQRPVVCYAQNLRGQVYQAAAWQVAAAEQAALQLCQNHSLLRCTLRGCQYE